MIDTSNSIGSSTTGLECAPATADQGLDKISALLGDLSRSPAAPIESTAAGGDHVNQENQFLAVRLGVATSLFYCLRGKHRQTADHSLRVALGCSAWADRLGLSDEVRDRLEVAALLHDIGKIATPDRILKKPSHLSGEEKLMMDRAPEMGRQILQGCCNDDQILDIIRFSRHWYEDREVTSAPSGDELPLGARMLAIVESFDSMTTDHVYRRAMSRERAVAELFQYAGTQFDPKLVRDFASLLESRPEVMYGSIARRWLCELNQQSSNRFWAAGHSDVSYDPPSGSGDAPSLIHRHLMENMSDGVVAIDKGGIITHWNFAFERMTNIAADSIIGQSWSDKVIRWYDPRRCNHEERCCLLSCLTSGTHSRRRMRMVLPNGKETPVMLNFVPILDNQNQALGAFAIVNDISQEESLAREMKSLHARATRDGLTGVANRTEFDRMLAELVELAVQGKSSASLIICDIDKFKSINDRYGHQAGDEALVSFASILSRHSRDGDLVARYGGEEFVLLCPGCDNATAAKRSELIRQELERTRHEQIGGNCITASFGVTEFQAGDTADTMVARADRALYKAKENGRNRVVQLGSGTLEHVHSDNHLSRPGWLKWLTSKASFGEISAKLVTSVPVDMVVEKLRGFIADHNAEILSIKDQTLELRVDEAAAVTGRRRSDSIAAFRLVVDLNEQPMDSRSKDSAASAPMQTVIDASVAPWRSRDRRGREANEACRNMIASLKSYLMADYVR